jgi:multidrug efflux pump subunit AcrA (membrane-fusion protein)
MKKALLYMTLLIVVSICGFLGNVVLRLRSDAVAGAPVPKVLFYQDSMHPWVKSAQPGKCSVCGMDLTPICQGQSVLAGADNVVMLNSNNITVLNVQTEKVNPQRMGRTLRVAGTLEANETKKTIVAAPAAGRIDDLAVQYAGLEVREGDRLATFYSPELTLEKRRYLVRARMSVQRDPTGGLAKPMSDSDPYYNDLIAPQTGTIVEREVYKGQYVADGQKMFTIVDLSVLWFRFDVYEQQLPWLALGQTIEVTVPAVPGKVFTAVISFIEPMLNESTRTFKVRADIQNPLIEINGHRQRLLGLGVYADGDVHAEFQSALAVPRSAILSPGRSTYAYVERGNGAYEKRRVKLGHKGDELWEVLSGLGKGERVVTSGSVLIDAQVEFSHAEQPGEFSTMGAESVDGTGNQVQRPALITSTVVVNNAEHHEMLEMAVHAERQPPARSEQMAAMPAIRTSNVITQIKTTSVPRRQMHASMQTASPGFRNNRLGLEGALFNRVAEMRTSELADAAAAVGANQRKLTTLQRKELRAFVLAADGISQALAEDDLESFKQHSTEMAKILATLNKEFGSAHAFSGLVQNLTEAGKVPPAKDLAEARMQFLPFGAGVTELTKELKKDDQAFAGLRIYHCPMAPKPGLWMQAKGPLRNPFYGSKMLNCGEEVLR